MYAGQETTVRIGHWMKDWFQTGKGVCQSCILSPCLLQADVKNWLIWKDPDGGKDWSQEEKGTSEAKLVWMASLTWWTWVWVNSKSWWWTGKSGVLQSIGVANNRTRLSNLTELNFRWIPGISPMSILIRIPRKPSFVFSSCVMYVIRRG